MLPAGAQLPVAWSVSFLGGGLLRVFEEQMMFLGCVCASVNIAIDSCVLRLYEQDPACKWLQEIPKDAERNTGSQPSCLATVRDVLPRSGQHTLLYSLSCSSPPETCIHKHVGWELLLFMSWASLLDSCPVWAAMVPRTSRSSSPLGSSSWGLLKPCRGMPCNPDLIILEFSATGKNDRAISEGKCYL